jgi:hypothetical protein
MTIGSLNDDHITYLDALTGRIAVYAFASILESYFKKLIILFLVHSSKPVVNLEFTTALTIAAIKLAAFITLYRTASGAIIFL